MKVATLKTLLVAITSLSYSWAATWAADTTKVAAVSVGATAKDTGSLRDLLGNGVRLADIEGDTVVLTFLGVDCPLANLYTAKLVKMHEEYHKRGVTFVAVYANRPETLDQVATHAYEHDLPFLIVKDFNAEFADSLGVSRTPTAVVLDGKGIMKYRGRIDDQYGVASRRPKARRTELRDAVDAVLAGETVKHSEVPADGCPLNRRRPAVRTTPVTFAKDVAPIVRENCAGCHRPGEIGPMTLLTYDDVVVNAEGVAEVVEQRRMPPWHADEHSVNFSNDRRLTDEEVATLLGWFEQEMPKGDSQTAAPVAEIPKGRWLIEPDLKFAMPSEATIPAEGVMPYQYYLVPTNFEEDRWVVGSQALAGNPEVVHHVIVYFSAPGRGGFFGTGGAVQLVAIGGPGEGTFQSAEDTALRLPAGTELLFEMHYTPNGVATTDRSELGLVFADEPPKRELRINMFGDEDLHIPARAMHHSQSWDFTFDKRGRIYGLLPHMHWRGKAYRAWLERPDGEVEKLLSVPRYDFNWQTHYHFADPIEVEAGTVVKSVAHWDNSANNPSNPDPDVDVEYGLQTDEEMMYGFLQYIYDEPIEDVEPSPPNALARLYFNSMDKDKDGLVTPEEMPANMRQMLLDYGMEFQTGITPLVFEEFADLSE